MLINVTSDIIYELLCLPMLLQTLFMNFVLTGVTSDIIYELYTYRCYFRHYL